MDLIVFTDLDGTLLDHRTYSWTAATDALQALRTAGVPLVIVTSKTRFEVEALRRTLGNTDPYIVENGAAVYWEGGGHVFGEPRSEAVTALLEASVLSGVAVRGFAAMPVEEIAERTGLPLETAALAARREFGEPFVVLDGNVEELAAAIGEKGFTIKQGGRFYHVAGSWDKATAVHWLLHRHTPQRSLALGDAPNDFGMLDCTDDAVIVRGKHAEAMRALLPHVRVTEEKGPAGWNAAVLEWLHERFAPPEQDGL